MADSQPITETEFDPNDRADLDQLQARAESVAENETNTTTITFEDLSNREALTLISCLTAGIDHYKTVGEREQYEIAEELHDDAAEQAADVYEPLHTFYRTLLAREIAAGRITPPGEEHDTLVERIYYAVTNPLYNFVALAALTVAYLLTSASIAFGFGIVPASLPGDLVLLIIFLAAFHIATRLTTV